jgi:hypothetical protein
VAGHVNSTKFIESVIDELPRHTRRPALRNTTPRSSPKSKIHVACLPPEKSVLATRPHQQVSGIRQVPILAAANGIPFLRLKKPQPHSLSRILRQKLDARNKNFTERTLLSNYWLPIAGQEDRWDDILRDQTSLEDAEPEVRWKTAVRDSFAENRIVYEKMISKDIMIAKKMQSIVDQEKILAAEEKQKATMDIGKDM